MAQYTEPLLQDCAKCGTLIDVTDEEPFARMHCPGCGESLRVRRQFDHFEIQEALGSGGMGTVYRARDHNLHRSVALKVLRKDLSDDPEFIQQFEHEAAITALITHPNVVKVYSTGSNRGLFFIAMELVDKGSLDDLMMNDGAVSELKALEVGIQIAHGLNAALKRGLIHRDVKPGNILFADARNSKIVDFGLAVPMDQAGTVGGEIWGTPYYVAPEKLANLPEDFRSDMYSLAASLFHAIAAQPPCETDDATIGKLLELKRTLKPLEQVAPGVSSETAYVINRALKADPDERYQTYEEFIEHLEYARTEALKREAAAAKAARQVPSRGTEARRAVSWVTLGVLTAVALGGATVYTYRDAIFGSRRQPPVADTTAKDSPSHRYEKARALLGDGKFAEAAGAFREVENASARTHPLQEWATLHAGLSHLLADRGAEGQVDFQRLAERKPYSHEPGRLELAQFLVTTGGLLAKGEQPESPLVSTEIANDHRAMLPFLWGARAWSDGDLPRAGILFRQFVGTPVEESYDWIRSYHPLAERLAAEAEEYARIVAIWNTAQTPEAQEQALPQLEAAAEEAKLSGKPGILLQRLIAEAKQAAAAAKAERARLTTQFEEIDRKEIDAVRRKADQLSLQFRFTEAEDALKALQPRTEKGRQLKALLVKRANWLGSFKTGLADDLRDKDMRARMAQVPVVNRAGKRLEGTIVSASSVGLIMTTQFGTSTVSWDNISVHSVYAIASAILRPDPLTGQAAHRHWRLGIFAFLAGKPTEGRALLREAARLNQMYKNEIPDALAAFGIRDGSAVKASDPSPRAGM